QSRRVSPPASVAGRASISRAGSDGAETTNSGLAFPRVECRDALANPQDFLPGRLGHSVGTKVARHLPRIAGQRGEGEGMFREEAGGLLVCGQAEKSGVEPRFRILAAPRLMGEVTGAATGSHQLFRIGRGEMFEIGGGALA